MSSLEKIETATKHYSDQRELLIMQVTELHDAIEELKRQRMPAIKTLAAQAANARNQLELLIGDNRSLFVKPRSVIYSGIKVGLQKGKGQLNYEDESTVIKLIRKQLPPEQHDLLIKNIERIIKKALAVLDAASLKKIGVTISNTGDLVLIKPVDSDVDKIVNAMLQESAGDVEAG